MGCSSTCGRANSGPGSATACREMVTWWEDKEHPGMVTAALAPAKRALSPAVLH